MACLENSIKIPFIRFLRPFLCSVTSVFLKRTPFIMGSPALNMSKITVLLYTTLGCHLCEQAKQVLWQVSADFPLLVQDVEISESDDLIEQYGVRIPVIALDNDGAELGWPFSHSDVVALLQTGSVKKNEE